jgi:stage II sporulation protein M
LVRAGHPLEDNILITSKEAASETALPFFEVLVQGKDMVKKLYKEIGNYFVSDIKKIFLIQLAVFFLVTFISILITLFLTEGSFIKLTSFFSERIMPLFRKESLRTWQGIGKNNIMAAGLMIIYGFLPFIFLPFFMLIYNATLVGVLLGIYQRRGLSAITLFLKGIMPHGIIEIPVIVLASSLGVSICLNFCRVILKKKSPMKWENEIRMTAMTYFFLIIPLLALAALIEHYITPLILKG